MGPIVSTYVRIVSIVAEEAGLTYDVVPYFAGNDFSLADAFFYPMLRAVAPTPEGSIFVGELPAIADWLDRVADRPSAAGTSWPREETLGSGGLEA